LAERQQEEYRKEMQQLDRTELRDKLRERHNETAELSARSGVTIGLLNASRMTDF